jgi:F0F1-type ATP synthase assembly protein I
MRRFNDRNEALNNAMKVAKRIAITILCCIPVVIIFGYLTRNVITANWLQILCFMLIMGIAVAIVEVIARAKEKQQKEEVETKRDVFR